MFKITEGKGFHITMPNGYKMSVQFGPGNYCDNYDMRWDDFYKKRESRSGYSISSETAEIAIFDPKGDMISLDNGETVMGHLTSAEVLYQLVKMSIIQKDENAPS